MATLIALTTVGYIGQALFMKGITETAGSIYDTIHDVCFTNCPELLAFLEEFDLEFKINTIQQFFNEIEIEKNHRLWKVIFKTYIKLFYYLNKN